MSETTQMRTLRDYHPQHDLEIARAAVSLAQDWRARADEEMQWSGVSDACNNTLAAHVQRDRARVYRDCAVELERLVQEETT
jgi:hypothetical protein